MANTADLHIQEILPLLDFTCNDFSKEILLNILREPLSCVHDILIQQQILQGFITNLHVLQGYSYLRTDMLEVHSFLTKAGTRITKKSLTLRLLLSEKERHQTRSRFIQLVLLFHKLQASYLSRVDLKPFPGNYKMELQQMQDFFSGLHLAHYEELIREQKFSVKHITELTAIIAEKSTQGEVTTFWKRYFLFEAYLSISFGIVKHGFSFPEFNETAFSFKEVYHPLVQHPVKNSFTINDPVSLLTGPNMSGKSTLLKAIALCVYLAHLGLAVPASKAEMPFFDDIFVFIHFTDDIMSGYSHFMTQVINLKKVVMEAISNKRCFAVFDELFNGTNIEDALAISSTTIKGLSKFPGSFFLISTHLHQLKEMEEVVNEVVSTFYIDCELKDNTPVFTYELKRGWSDLKVGQLLFEKEGLNEMLDRNNP